MSIKIFNISGERYVSGFFFKSNEVHVIYDAYKVFLKKNAKIKIYTNVNLV